MEPEKKGGGAFVGLIIIIIILVLGGLYMWKINKDTLVDQDVNTETKQTEIVTEQDTNDLDLLEQDANAIDASVGVDASSIN